MHFRSTIIGALFALAAVPALGQSSSAVRVSGTVDKVDATSITLKNHVSGAVESFRLAPNWLAVENKPATLADIKPNDFVASAAVRGVDGKLHSTELRIFPAAMRGSGEGQRPMNDARNQTMTNADVTGAAVVNGSNDIKVKFQGGESELVLDPGVPVTRIEAVDKARVKPGVEVRLQGLRSADGVTVSRVTIQ